MRTGTLMAMLFVSACAGSPTPPPSTPTTPPPPAPPTSSTTPASSAPEKQAVVPPTQAPACPSGRPMRVHFYDAGQALSVLVTLPDGRHVLVDTGESPRRPCTGCKAWHERVMGGLTKDLGTGKLDLLWITHQHSDHIGGAKDVLGTFAVALYVDNGLDLDRTAAIRDARVAVTSSGAKLRVVDPEHPEAPISPGPGVTLTPIVPAAWPSACAGDPNACSIALRIDYCKSSVLFTGDAPRERGGCARHARRGHAAPGRASRQQDVHRRLVPHANEAEVRGDLGGEARRGHERWLLPPPRDHRGEPHEGDGRRREEDDESVRRRREVHEGQSRNPSTGSTCPRATASGSRRGTATST